MVTTDVFHRSFDLTLKSNGELQVSTGCENDRTTHSPPHPSFPHPHTLTHSHAQLLLALQNNSLELHLLTPSTHPVTSSLHSAITAPGHRSDIRYTLLPPSSSLSSLLLPLLPPPPSPPSSSLSFLLLPLLPPPPSLLLPLLLFAVL